MPTPRLRPRPLRRCRLFSLASLRAPRDPALETCGDGLPDRCSRRSKPAESMLVSAGSIAGESAWMCAETQAGSNTEHRSTSGDISAGFDFLHPAERDSLLDWLALIRLEGVGPVSLRRLLERFGSPEGVFSASSAELLDPALGLRRSHRDALRSGPDLDWAQEQIRHAERHGAAIVTLDDPQYPAFLRTIHAPPPVLFALGCVPLEHPRAVGVVGTRAPSQPGGDACGRLVRDWVRSGARIVSGLARGIDEIAHRAALEAGGETLAVLGCGLDQIDSAPRRALSSDISRQGSLVTEFPFGSPVHKGNFPRRNRIIAGLSRAVVVAEAGERSGALVTARHALEQGREVLACPGPAGWESFAGCHRLLRQGAALCARPEDLCETLGWEATPVRTSGDPLLHLLSGQTATIEEIAISTRRSIPEIEHRIVLLELSGEVVRCDGGRWRRSG